MRKDRLIYKDVREYMEEVAEEISMDKEKFIETAQRYLENNHEGADIDLEKLFKSFGKTEDNSHEIKFW
jgi:DNA replication initiation complex subunit (GINS family)